MDNEQEIELQIRRQFQFVLFHEDNLYTGNNYQF